MLFSVWDQHNYSVDWHEVEGTADLLDIQTVPVLYRGKFDLDVLKSISRTMDLEAKEGFVIRNSGRFHYDDFAQNMGKFVRPAHVTTETHWMHAEIVPNGIVK